MSEINHRLESAREIVAREWRARRPVQLDTSGAWHRCIRGQCNITQLVEHVCIEGNHVVSGQVCLQHPLEQVVLVKDLYACEKVGSVHVCNRITCPISHGHCEISGLTCAAAKQICIEVPANNSRTKRRPSGVHTNEQGACILLFDLLFSARRVRYEVKRAEASIDIARRHSQRLVRTAARLQTPVPFQKLLDMYTECRGRLRSVQHLTSPLTTVQKQSICRHYASIFVKIWELVMSKLPARCTFEGTALAIMYGMRRGVAYDGLLAIPYDKLMATALPDAHAITEVGFSRRALTQSKNALFDALQQCIHTSNRVEEFQSIYTPCSLTSLIYNE